MNLFRLSKVWFTTVFCIVVYDTCVHITCAHKVHLIRMLMVYTCCTSTGTGVLRTTVWTCCGYGTGISRAYCQTKDKVRWWYSFGETVENVSKFWNRCGSHWEEKTLVSMEYYRINGVTQRQIRVYATVATGIHQIQVQIRAYMQA